MDKAAIKAAILQFLSEEIDIWLDKQEKITNGYEYEDQFMATAQRVNKILLSRSIGKLPGSRNKKNQSCFGKIEVSKSHPLCQHTKSFGITGKLQEIMCLLGQSEVFEDGEQLLKKLLGIGISAKQIQRVSEHYGSVIEEEQATYVKDNKEVPVLPLKNKEEPVYMMFDGGMVFTRDGDGWKEMKVGRIFSSSSCVSVQPKRNQILQSFYEIGR